MKNENQVQAEISDNRTAKQAVMSLEELKSVLYENILAVEEAYKKNIETIGDNDNLEEWEIAHFKVEAVKERANLIINLADEWLKLEACGMDSLNAEQTD